jgi:hypothetical protein
VRRSRRPALTRRTVERRGSFVVDFLAVNGQQRPRDCAVAEPISASSQQHEAGIGTDQTDGEQQRDELSDVPIVASPDFESTARSFGVIVLVLVGLRGGVAVLVLLGPLAEDVVFVNVKRLPKRRAAVGVVIARQPGGVERGLDAYFDMGRPRSPPGRR